jgi:hypothetical protein
VEKKTFKKNTIAFVYDFDGTLSPQPMQEYTVLPAINMQPQVFWQKVKKEAKEHKAEEILTYMRLMYEEAHSARVSIKRADLANMGQNIQYYAGVEDWFDRINQYVKERSAGKVKIHHYIVSAGLKEILEGTTIKKKFTQIYASEYYFDHDGVAKFPNRLVTDTSKIQYLFRINKGKEDLGESINKHMPEAERPIPFSNIIYIGDGETDVPSMTVTRQQGGHAIAVYKPSTRKGRASCLSLFNDGRVDFYAPAIYTADSELEKRTKALLDKVIADILFCKDCFSLDNHHE